MPTSLSDNNPTIQRHVDLPMPHTSKHHMITQSKASISKKKLFFCKTKLDIDYTEPSTTRQALSKTNWTKAMHHESLAL